MNRTIDNDLLDNNSEDKEEIDEKKDCLFCKMKEGKLSKMDIRLILDMHEQEEYSILCSRCNEIIKF